MDCDTWVAQQLVATVEGEIAARCCALRRAAQPPEADDANVLTQPGSQDLTETQAEAIIDSMGKGVGKGKDRYEPS